MQKIQFNIISRDDWEVLASKQFGYFYFVVDDTAVLNGGGDLYLGENLIGSGLTIEQIVEYFENPDNIHTFSGITSGDIIPRGETDIDITERLGICMQNNNRYIKNGSADLVTIEGIIFDEEDPSTVLEYGLNLGGYQSWTPSRIQKMHFSGENPFFGEPIVYSGSYNFVFPVVKGVAGKYGLLETGKNNGYVVVGGKETFVGWCSSDDFDGTMQSFSEIDGVRLEGQPEDDLHTYYIPEYDGWMCVRYSSQPSVSQDGIVTVDGTEVGCHLAMDNKMDDKAGKLNGVLLDLEYNGEPTELLGIGASDEGHGASDSITFNGSDVIRTQNIDSVSVGDLSWDHDDGEYDSETGNYIYHWIATVDGMKPGGTIAVTGGSEQAFEEAYSNGTNLVIVGYGDSTNPYNHPGDLDVLFYEVASPNVTTIRSDYPGNIPASKYGTVSSISEESNAIGLVPKEQSPFFTIRYQQSGADQIWNAIVYQKEMAEVTAAALNDLNNRIENSDTDLSNIYDEIDEISEVTATALNDLNGRLSDVENAIEILDDIPQWEGTDSYRLLTFRAEIPNSTIGIENIGNPEHISIQYSTDGRSTWNIYTIGDTITLTNIGDTVKFRGENQTFSSSSLNYYQFEMVGKISSSGDVTSLLNGVGGDVDLTGKAYCFFNLFNGCTALTTAPELPATTLAQYCYSSMFQGCTSLTTAPELPATTLANYCYQSMFQGCTAITVAPELPVTTLSNYCYYSMFQGCTALTTSPELPATTLANYCYQSMFQGCTSLTTAPELPATTLLSGCYNSMFQNCSNLNHIKAMFIKDPSNSRFTQNWVSGVAESGTFLKNTSANWNVTGTNGVPIGWTINTCGELTFTNNSLDSALTVSIVKTGNPDDIYIQVSSDNGATWLDYTMGMDLILHPGRDSIKFRGINTTFSKSLDDFYSFSLSGYAHVSGDVTSLINGVGGDCALPSYCFCSLFDSCTEIDSTPNLPSTILSRNCYHSMFAGCTSLAAAPELPATTLADNCYNCMFQGCTSLSAAPELPATTLADNCYDEMFTGCNALEIAPELPATTLSSGCYSSMFYDCTALDTAPDLPAMTLAKYCYQSMFQGCTSLTIAPELPATTLANYCYQSMFQGCTSLTTAPELPATTLLQSCYQYMFTNCSNLNYIKAMFTTTPTITYTRNWVAGVASTGTFVKNSEAQWDVSGSYGIPTNWTVQTTSE